MTGLLDCRSQVYLLWKLRTEILPSLEAQARMGPRSYGAQAIELTNKSASPFVVQYRGSTYH
jgi:hypothetical protein